MRKSQGRNVDLSQLRIDPRLWQCDAVNGVKQLNYRKFCALSGAIGQRWSVSRTRVTCRRQAPDGRPACHPTRRAAHRADTTQGCPVGGPTFSDRGSPDFLLRRRGWRERPRQKSVMVMVGGGATMPADFSMKAQQPHKNEEKNEERGRVLRFEPRRGSTHPPRPSVPPTSPV